jgi:hypothetical protein
MKNKERYTKQELNVAIIEAVSAYSNYEAHMSNYILVSTGNTHILEKEISLEETKKEVNQAIEVCKKKFPKGLIKKLEMKKIE